MAQVQNHRITLLLSLAQFQSDSQSCCLNLQNMPGFGAFLTISNAAPLGHFSADSCLACCQGLSQCEVPCQSRLIKGKSNHVLTAYSQCIQSQANVLILMYNYIHDGASLSKLLLLGLFSVCFLCDSHTFWTSVILCSSLFFRLFLDILSVCSL